MGFSGNNNKTAKQFMSIADDLQETDTDVESDQITDLRNIFKNSIEIYRNSLTDSFKPFFSIYDKVYAAGFVIVAAGILATQVLAPMRGWGEHHIVFESKILQKKDNSSAFIFQYGVKGETALLFPDTLEINKTQKEMIEKALKDWKPQSMYQMRKFIERIKKAK